MDAEIMVFAATSITGLVGAVFTGWKASQAKKSDIRSEMVRDLYEILGVQRSLLAEEKAARIQDQGEIQKMREHFEGLLREKDREIAELKSTIAAMREECPRFRGLACDALR